MKQIRSNGKKLGFKEINILIGVTSMIRWHSWNRLISFRLIWSGLFFNSNNGRKTHKLFVILNAQRKNNQIISSLCILQNVITSETNCHFHSTLHVQDFQEINKICEFWLVTLCKMHDSRIFHKCFESKHSLFLSNSHSAGAICGHFFQYSNSIQCCSWISYRSKKIH